MIVTTFCAVDGCQTLKWARTLCAKHYAMAKRAGTLPPAGAQGGKKQGDTHFGTHENSIMSHLTPELRRLYDMNKAAYEGDARSMETWYAGGCLPGYEIERDYDGS